METPDEFRERMRSVGVIKNRRSEKIRERIENGERIKEVTDELGNTVTQYSKGDRQSVTLRPSTVAHKASVHWTDQ